MEANRDPRDFVPTSNVQPPAVDFIDNHIDEYHPAFSNPPSRYDPRLKQYVICQTSNFLEPQVSPDVEAQVGTAAPLPSEYDFTPRPLPQPTAALDFWEDLFPTAMDRFQMMHPVEPDAVAKYRIRDRKSWTEVFDQLEAAKVQYYQTKGFKGGFRKIYRKSGDNVQPLIGVAKALPDIDMVTPVLGITYFQAAKQAAQVRQAMSGAFDGIEPMFSQIELFLKIYPGDENIKRASVELIAVTFHAVECVIGFFVKSTCTRSASSSPCKSLEAVKTHSEALTTEANNSDKYMSSNIVKRVVQATHQSEKRILQTVHSERTMILTLFQELHDNLARKQTAENAAMFNMVQHHLSQFITSMAPPTSTPPPPIRWPAVSTSGALVTSEQLLGLMNIPNWSAIDLHAIEERRNDLIPKEQQAKAEHIINTTEFRRWLTSAASSQLLVHGNFDPRPMSGTTHFCATLIRHIAEHPRHISLNFFCGQHLEPDSHAGGRAMIQTFICQLLSQYNFDPQYKVDQNLELIKAGDVKELFKLFDFLFRGIDPSLCVFCIIDSVVFYERDEFLRDLGDVIPMLVKLSAERLHDASMPVFKVLIASPIKTEVVRRLFVDEQILSMATMAEHIEDPSQMRVERRLKEESSFSSSV
ncbi:hypothetical protein PpBr36_05492 [Pyricularia pennisetigena]|uniref:hypothetical protein n=1 Tax=Pyricularia pennisetigena TaxID=1578925 RepID=UPI0011515E8D|nr:hypothetical protein PpBr36_05492 [Pyricularia pennisetigena]TLS26548.1 hypothetical protein PpBr36_05492 [Pyricularia pennisetigena]